MAEMHRATPGAARRLLTHMAIVTIVGGAFIAVSQAYQPQLLDWARSDPAKMRGRAQLLIAVAGVIFLAPLVGLAAYVWRLGTRTLSEERFPPERMAVIRDVVVMRGAEARSRGRLFHAIGVVFLALAGLLALTLWRLATLAPGV